MDLPKRIDDHENRISALEKQYGEVVKDIGEIKEGQNQLENTVLRESSAQKSILVAQNSTLLDHVLQINKGQEEVKGQVKLTKIAAEKEIKVARLTTGEKIIVGIMTAPGLLLAVFEYIPKLFN